MAKLKATNIPKLARSDQYLEFLISDTGNNEKRYSVAIYDDDLREFVKKEEPIVVRPVNGKIEQSVIFSDIDALDKGSYWAFLFDITAEPKYSPLSGDIQRNKRGNYSFIRNQGGPNVNLLAVVPFELETKSAIQTSIVRLERANIDETPDLNFWEKIIETNLDFNQYKEVMDRVLFYTDPEKGSDLINYLPPQIKKRLPFVGAEEYSLLKFVTYEYMRKSLKITEAQNYFGGNNGRLPYYDEVVDDVDEIIDEVNGYKAVDGTGHINTFTDKRLERIPCIELIWSYWMEQGMLVQSMNAISLRFQNVKGIREVEPLGRFDTSPLRALSHILWGYIQDEQHTVSLSRRVNEYDHEYGLNLLGRAVPQLRTVDTRSKFLEAFHNLLTKCAIFYKEIDDTTRKPDGFPIYTSLKELHLLLAEGNHNAYQNLTWTVRQEMMVQQYILARNEMREFLGGRPMMPYQERWMDKVDTMKMLQGWDPTSIIHYYDLAYCGEKVLLGIRYGNWNNVGIGANSASNWAVAFRNLVQKYIHAYQTVSGVDLSADSIGASQESRATQPSLLIAGRTEGNKTSIEIRQRARMRRY